MNFIAFSLEINRALRRMVACLFCWISSASDLCLKCLSYRGIKRFIHICKESREGKAEANKLLHPLERTSIVWGKNNGSSCNTFAVSLQYWLRLHRKHRKTYTHETSSANKLFKHELYYFTLVLFLLFTYQNQTPIFFVNCPVFLFVIWFLFLILFLRFLKLSYWNLANFWRR